MKLTVQKFLETCSLAIVATFLSAPIVGCGAADGAEFADGDELADTGEFADNDELADSEEFANGDELAHTGEIGTADFALTTQGHWIKNGFVALTGGENPRW